MTYIHRKSTARFTLDLYGNELEKYSGIYANID